MDSFFVPKRDFIQLLCFWVWFCFAMLGSSLTESQSTITFKSEPSSQTVKAGSLVTLACSASYGSETISYEWEYNSELLPLKDSRLSMAPDGTLQISKAMFEDQGIYRCKASRRNGDVSLSKPATLTVHCSLSVKPNSGSGIYLTGKVLQLRFKCLKSPDATYTWTKNGSLVVLDSRVTKNRNKLNINNTSVSDSGNYSCVATSTDNVTTPSSSISFQVIDGQSPRFLEKPSTDSVVVEGRQEVFNCKASGAPAPKIEWYAGDDNNPMANSSDRTIFRNGSLVLYSVGRQDAMKYKCVASNLVGNVATETELKIAYLEKVSTRRKKWYVLKNEKMEIECKASGLPDPTIKWQMANGGDLPKRFGVTGCCILQNNSTKLSDSGNYTCSASNKAGTQKQTIQIIVSTAPKIKVKPKDQRLKEGDKAVMNCSVHSDPKQKIIWLKDGKRLKEDKEHVVSTQGNLVIPKAKPDDSGIYKCYVNHPGGWTDEAEANLTVMAAVKLRTLPFGKVKANLGRPLRIECEFVGYPPIKVHWRKYGADKLPDRIQLVGNALVITSVEKDDAGRYICNGSNDFSVLQSSINVSVYMYPVFQVRPKNTTAYIDDSVWLHCNASGDPPPKISWGKEAQGGDKLDPERFFTHSNGTLNIKNVQVKDEGRYYCVAANEAEMKQITISLTVKAALPVPVKKTASMGRTIGIAVGCAAAYIVLVVGLMIYCKGRRARQNRKEEIAATEFAANGEIEHHEGEVHDMMLNPVHGNPSNYDKMEFPRHDLEALRTLGNGAYGRAFLARASGIRDGENETVVVVKALMSKDDMVREEFSKEMEALTSIQHRNVVTLLGICKDDPSYLIFESLEKGDLKQFLLSGYDNGRCTMTSSQKLSMCAQLATGMNYLASEGFVHKDLAARNCMVGRELEVKIGFLSLSYDLYSAEYYRFNNIQIPLRWMSPEAIFDDEYTEKSDVWSYGVVVWEIYSLGQLPYHDRSDEEVLKCVKSDLRLPKPDNCPDTVLEILEKCWEGNPTSRPAFAELMDEVSGISVDSHV